MRRSQDLYNDQSPHNPEIPDNTPPEPEEDPTHDVPAFPDQDSPPGTVTARGPGGATHASHGPPREGMPRNMRGQWPRKCETPDEGEDDVDDDDLDPQVPHSPPDGRKSRELELRLCVRREPLPDIGLPGECH
jgi:hypothetical protein